jgi:ankyrin repeat protein
MSSAEAVYTFPEIIKAVIARDFDRLKDLVENQGVDVNQQDKYGDTALHACVKNDEFVSYLLSKGASPNIQNNSGSTVLHKAALSATPETVSVLLAAKADPTIKNIAGYLPEQLTFDVATFTKLLGADLQTDTILVPKAKHGAIRGKNGANLRRIQFETKALLKVPLKDNDQEDITILGRQESLAEAKSAILAITFPVSFFFQFLISLI